MLIAIDTDDERGAHHFSTHCGTQPDGTLRKNHHGIPNFDAPTLRTAEASRGDVCEQHHLFIGDFVWDFCQICLGVGNQQILRLGSIDCIAKTPATHRLTAMSLPALRVLTRKTRAALPTRSDGTHQHPVSDVIARDPGAELLDHTHGLMADDQTGFHRVFPTNNVQVRAADRGRRDS